MINYNLFFNILKDIYVCYAYNNIGDFMYPNNTLSLNKILGGLSKTLNIANKLLPLYKEAKPIIANAKNLYSIAKIINTKDQNKDIKNITEQKKEDIKISSTNNPNFFV